MNVAAVTEQMKVATKSAAHNPVIAWNAVVSLVVGIVSVVAIIVAITRSFTAVETEVNNLKDRITRIENKLDGPVEYTRARSHREAD